MAAAEFWNDWKNKTKHEKRCINAIAKAMKFLLKTVPKNKIAAVYVKGSFVRREMNAHSDVDMVPIVKDNDSLIKIRELQKKQGKKYMPAELLPLSIWECERNERYMTTGPKASPDITLSNLNNYKLIFGKQINTSKFKMRPPQRMFYSQIKAFENIFIPMYSGKKISLDALAKQVFWLTALEQKINGKNPPYDWKKLVKSVKNKNHIVNDALYLRNNLAKRQSVRKVKAEFLAKLKKHLAELKTIHRELF